MKVLVDTNIVLDVLLKRTPFYQDAFKIFQLADKGVITGYLSAVSMTDIFYLLRKVPHSYIEVYNILKELAAIFSVAPVSDVTISGALSLRWKDFEDAVQFIVASENGAECIITRNNIDYESSDIPCMNPTDFISQCIKNDISLIMD